MCEIHYNSATKIDIFSMDSQLPETTVLLLALKFQLILGYWTFPSRLIWAGVLFSQIPGRDRRDLDQPTIASYWLDLPCPVSLAVDEHPPPQNRMEPEATAHAWK